MIRLLLAFGLLVAPCSLSAEVMRSWGVGTGSIDTTKLASGAVDTTKLNKAAVTADAIAPGAVDSTKLVSGISLNDGVYVGAAGSLTRSTITAGNASFAGAVSAAQQPRAIVSTGTFVILNAVNTVIGYDTAISSAGGIPETISATSSKLYAPATGDYVWGCRLEYPAAATGMREVQSRVAGTTYGDVAQFAPGSNADTQRVSASGLLHLTAGQYVECIAYQNSGAPLTLTGTSRAWMYLLP